MLFLYVIAVVIFSFNPTTYYVATAVGVGLAITFFLEVATRRLTIVIPSPLICFAAYVCFTAFALIWLPGSTAMLLTLIQLLVLSIIIVSGSILGNGLTAIEFGFYVSIVYSFIYSIVSNEVPIDGRFASTLVNANTYAFVLMIGAFFAFRRIFLMRDSRSASKWSYVLISLFVALCVYGVFVRSVSRKGILLTMVGGCALLVYVVIRQPARRRLLVSVLVLLLLGGACYGLYQIPEFSRVSALSNLFSTGDVSAAGVARRASLLRDATDLWIQRPIFGWGLDMFRTVSGYGTYSHDNYVEILANQGLVGLVLFLSMYVFSLVEILRSAVRSPRDSPTSTALFWAMVILGVLVAWDVGAVSYYSKLNWIVLSVVVAIALRARVARARSRAEVLAGEAG